MCAERSAHASTKVCWILQLSIKLPVMRYLAEKTRLIQIIFIKVKNVILKKGSLLGLSQKDCTTGFCFNRNLHLDLSKKGQKLWFVMADGCDAHVFVLH